MKKKGNLIVKVFKTLLFYRNLLVKKKADFCENGIKLSTDIIEVNVAE